MSSEHMGRGRSGRRRYWGSPATRSESAKLGLSRSSLRGYKRASPRLAGRDRRLLRGRWIHAQGSRVGLFLDAPGPRWSAESRRSSPQVRAGRDPGPFGGWRVSPRENPQKGGCDRLSLFGFGPSPRWPSWLRRWSSSSGPTTRSDSSVARAIGRRAKSGETSPVASPRRREYHQDRAQCTPRRYNPPTPEFGGQSPGSWVASRPQPDLPPGRISKAPLTTR